MSKESRLIALSGLTLFLFALMGFLKDGSVIVPFPLNSFIFLIVSFQYMIWHYKKKALPYLFFLSGIAGVLGTEFLWETILSAQKLEIFYGYSIIDWSRLLCKVFLFLTGFYFIRAHREWFYKGLFTIGLVIQGYGIVVNDLKYQVIGLLCIVIANSLKPVHRPFHLLWALLFILEGSKWLSLVLMNR